MKYIINLIIEILIITQPIYGQDWKPIGPINRSGPPGYVAGQGAGMVMSIAFHPKYNMFDAWLSGINKTIFIGSRYGGVWISRDDGATWSNSDAQYPNLNTDLLPGNGIVDLVIDYIDPTIIYASMSSSESAFDYSIGIRNYHPCTGIYRYSPSTGWIALKTYPYFSNHSCSALTLDPVNPTILYASTSDGVLKFINSGASSMNILTNGPEKPFRNVVFDPANPTKIYASGNDVYLSANAGTTWTNISNFTTIIPNNSATVLVNIGVISGASIYAKVVYMSSIPTVGLKEVFYHYNGTLWESLQSIPDASYDHFSILAVKSGSTEYVFAGTIEMYRYSTAAPFWTQLSQRHVDMHADIHDIVFSPDKTTLWIAHDGGVSRTNSNFYSSPAWTTINQGLNIATIYSFSGSQKNPKLFLTGETDNGDSYLSNADPDNLSSNIWIGYQVGDGADKMISWDNPIDWYDRREMYASTPIFRNTTGIGTYSGLSKVFASNTMDPPATAGTTAHWFFEEFGDKKPIVMDPNNPNILYRGGANILMRSMDQGATSQVIFRKTDCFENTNTDFYGHITSVAIAPSNSNYLYINFINPYSWDLQFSNHIYKTTNALSTLYKAPCPHSSTNGVICGNWSDITPPFPGTTSINKKSVINTIVVSEKDPNTIWAGFSFNPLMSGFILWKFDGTTWTNYGQGLPTNISITSMVYEKGSDDGIYAGTDVAGIFYRNKKMSAWIPFGSLPHAKVVQMEINRMDNTIRAGTFGRGIWESSLYCPTDLNIIEPAIVSISKFLEAMNTINSTAKINAGVTVNYRAGDRITLKPGFTAKANSTSYFSAFIHPCDRPGNSFK